MIIIQISVPYFQSSHSKKSLCTTAHPPPPPPPSSLKNLSPGFCLCGEGEGGGWLYVKPATDLGQTGSFRTPHPETGREWKKQRMTWLSQVLQTPWNNSGNAPLYRHATSPQMERCVMKWRTERDLGWGLSNPRWRPCEQFQRDFWGLLHDQFLPEDEGFFLPGRL